MRTLIDVPVNAYPASMIQTVPGPAWWTIVGLFVAVIAALVTLHVMDARLAKTAGPVALHEGEQAEDVLRAARRRIGILTAEIVLAPIAAVLAVLPLILVSWTFALFAIALALLTAFLISLISRRIRQTWETVDYIVSIARFTGRYEGNQRRRGTIPKPHIALRS